MAGDGAFGPGFGTRDDPSAWQSLVVAYLFLGGVAAGAYAVSLLASAFGRESERRSTLPAHPLALGLSAACGAILLAGVLRGGPAARASASAWRGLGAFAAFALGSTLLTLVEWSPGGRLGDWPGRVARLRRSSAGRALVPVGLAAAVWLGATTGPLRKATWARPVWLNGALLASSAATGAAAVVVLDRRARRDEAGAAAGPGAGRLGRLVYSVAAVAEMAALCGLSLTVVGLDGLAFMRWPGRLIPLFVVPVGLVLPLVLREARGPRAETDAALLVLLGGFVLGYAVVGIPDSLLLK